MKAMFFKGVVLGAIVSIVTLAGSVALAGTGIGGIFNLGVTNTVNNPTTLTGNSTAAAGKPQLQVTNTSTLPGATGIGINVAAGKPPLAVNSSTQVAHLNASFLQGKASSAFLAANGTAANSNLLGGNPASFFLPANGTAADSNLLQGNPASNFMSGPGAMRWSGVKTATLGDPASSPVTLLTLGNWGTLKGYCGTDGYQRATVVLTTTQPVQWFGWDADIGFSGTANGSYFNVLPDSANFLGDMGWSQVGFGTENATIFASQWLDTASNKCTFEAQAVDTHL
jgi:hypothetical protein